MITPLVSKLVYDDDGNPEYYVIKIYGPWDNDDDLLYAAARHYFNGGISVPGQSGEGREIYLAFRCGKDSDDHSNLRIKLKYNDFTSENLDYILEQIRLHLQSKVNTFYKVYDVVKILLEKEKEEEAKE